MPLKYVVPNAAIYTRPDRAKAANRSNAPGPNGRNHFATIAATSEATIAITQENTLLCCAPTVCAAILIGTINTPTKTAIINNNFICAPFHSFLGDRLPSAMAALIVAIA